jgi:6-phosphogluconolactonase
VTVLTQPTSPAQVCSVASGTGTVAASNVSSVAVSCVTIARFVFVTNGTDGNNGDVSGFSVNPTTGALTAMTGSPFVADSIPNGVVVDHTGNFVYVSNRGTVDLSTFALDPVAQTLTLKHQSATSHTVPTSIALMPTNNFIFTAGFATAPATGGSIIGFGLNADSGTLTPVNAQQTPPQAPVSITVDPTGKFLFATVSSHFLYVYNIVPDGSLTLVTNVSAGQQPHGVAVWPGSGLTGGFVYTANGSPGSVSGFSYDSTGNLTSIGPDADAGFGTVGIAIDPTGKYLYATNYTDGTISAYSINAQTGQLTSLGGDVATSNNATASGRGPFDLKVDSSGQFVYCVNRIEGSVSLLTLAGSGSATPGALTLVATYRTGDGADAVAID